MIEMMAAIRKEKCSERDSYQKNKATLEDSCLNFCEERLRLRRTSTTNYIQNTSSILHKN